MDVGNAVATGNTVLPLVLMSASGDSNLRVLSLKFLVELAGSGGAFARCEVQESSIRKRGQATRVKLKTT